MIHLVSEIYYIIVSLIIYLPSTIKKYTVIENTNYIGIDLGGSCGKISHGDYPCLLCSRGNCNPNTKFLIENRKLLKK